VNIINNTIVSNDTTASSGVLFNTLGARSPAARGPAPLPAGRTVPVRRRSPHRRLSPPASWPYRTARGYREPAHDHGGCMPSGSLRGLDGDQRILRTVSYPELYNNVIWQNRTFNITVGGSARDR